MFWRFYLLIFRERVRKTESERNINVWLPLTHTPLGTWPATQACALPGNRTSDPVVCIQHSVHWTIPARAKINKIFKTRLLCDSLKGVWTDSRVSAEEGLGKARQEWQWLKSGLKSRQGFAMQGRWEEGRSKQRGPCAVLAVRDSGRLGSAKCWCG